MRLKGNKEYYRGLDSAKSTVKARKNSLVYKRVESSKKGGKKTKLSRASSQKRTEAQLKNSIVNFLGFRQTPIIRKSLDENIEDLKTFKSTRKSKEFSSFSQKFKKLSFEADSLSSYKKKALSLLNSLQGGNLLISKTSLCSMISSILDFTTSPKFQKGPPPSMKSQGIQKPFITFEEIENKAKKHLVEDIEEKDPDSFQSKIIKLTQKSIILDETLEILKEEGIDLNHMLSVIIEKIEAAYFVPPSDITLESGVSLVLEDKMRMPTPKLNLGTLQDQLRLNLANIKQKAEAGKSSRSNFTDKKQEMKNDLLQGYNKVQKKYGDLVAPKADYASRDSKG